MVETRSCRKKTLVRNLERINHGSYLAIEKDALQGAMTPFLQGEKDIAFAVNDRAFKKKIAELMKDEKDFDVNQKFFSTDRHYQYPVYGNGNLGKFRGTGLLEGEQKH